MLRLDTKAFDIKTCISEIKQLQNELPNLSIQAFGNQMTLYLTTLSNCIENELRGALYDIGWRDQTDSAIDKISAEIDKTRSKLLKNNNLRDQQAAFSLRFDHFCQLVSLFRRFLDERRSAIGAGTSTTPRVGLRRYDGYNLRTAKQPNEHISTPFGNIKIPPEAPAPIRIIVEEERFKLILSHTHTGSLSSAALDRVRKSILDTFTIAFEILEKSHNLDSRFIPSCRPLLNHLSMPVDQISIEAFGLNYRIVQSLMKDNYDAIPSIALIQFEHALQSSNVLLNQFEEWRNYEIAEAITKLNLSDISKVVSAGEEIAKDVIDAKSIVEQKISALLMEMIAPAKAGLINVDTISAPLIGSISNFFAQCAYELLQAHPEISKSIEKLWSFTRDVTILTEKGVSNPILIFALYIIARYAPILSDLQPFRFMKDAYEIAIKKFPWAKDTLLK